MLGVKIENLYPLLLPAGNSDAATGLRQRQLELMRDIVARGVLPGIMLAFAGPDSRKTAEFVTEVLKDAKPDSLKDVIVLVVGDEQRVNDAIKPTSATVHFVAM